jgi:ribosomal protein S18 acetylase RimI-like enzyme
MPDDQQRTRPQIEVASSHDAPAILALQRRAYRVEAELYDDAAIAPLRETVDEVRAEAEAGRILKVTIDGVFAGAVRARMDGTTCHVGRLIVEPEVQNRGLGSTLLRAVEQRCPPGTRLELFTGHRSERNLHLYRKHGYREFRRGVVTPTLTFVFLEKIVVE